MHVGFCFLLLVFTDVVLALSSRSVTFKVTNAISGQNIFVCARTVMSNTYVGARRRTRRDVKCETLNFTWFKTSDVENQYIYFLKTCVSHRRPEVCVCVWHLCLISITCT